MCYSKNKLKLKASHISVFILELGLLVSRYRFTPRGGDVCMYGDNYNVIDGPGDEARAVSFCENRWTSSSYYKVLNCRYVSMHKKE